ncbi:AglZ/HisF2 family acetamidino modification protein [Parachitinimonas caeni]|uniref:imidazole glycerol-phosphate synthase n=1 Tax=Parachitinimonas caeni TaxID=3031301 RepID=A0ABT7DUX1_9NEIS|nr:AglZ/HisF2 family acetamidino modification protein [Parachitinimonas caeni]MDK2122888.1 AglZ/HisF2 family acetamidino modification protein [Parachitinimonas caeni]
MLTQRAIPCLLISDGGLVKTVGFKPGKYVGDPINAVKIFNEKEVDELVFLDIDASRQNREPDYELIEQIASECFSPIAYGGGIRTFEQAVRIIRSGVEKVVLNSVLFDQPEVLTHISQHFGAQSAVAVLNIKRDWRGRYRIYDSCRNKTLDHNITEYARQLERLGAGELMLSDVDRDGTMQGYDLALIQQIVNAVSIPVIACGGAGKLADLRSATQDGGAAAVAVGSLFVFYGRHRAVLINYPEYRELQSLFKDQI